MSQTDFTNVRGAGRPPGLRAPEDTEFCTTGHTPETLEAEQLLERLVGGGFHCGGPERAREGLRRFQSEVGLPATGRLDARTRARLKDRVDFMEAQRGEIPEARDLDELKRAAETKYFRAAHQGPRVPGYEVRG